MGLGLGVWGLAFGDQACLARTAVLWHKPLYLTMISTITSLVRGLAVPELGYQAPFTRIASESGPLSMPPRP